MQKAIPGLLHFRFAAGTSRGSLRKSNTYVFDFRRPIPWGVQQGEANSFWLTLLV
jgi:hypothetical protein